ncbi:MFS transporter [Alicyclobacillus fastidiosus]|uniref:MFS transporter n=1 Tax=Alicyclobacillus fastidiosus TaxID=392011 RepID=A0ABY6ZMA6_9BACL|nr:MFS transporter [Alicyclobacillus fastidiosus]WAH43229.1 MFS transporter [Alicyclobacillus fastidiosus]GMA65265.1 putative MFS-type transporter YttB [Alicyclobacillus fastidiosus]
MIRALSRSKHMQTDIPLVVWLLGLGCLLNVGGLSLLWPVNSIYIHTSLHKSMAVAGMVMMVYSGTGLLGSFIGGWLYDRFGAMRVMVFTLVVSCLVILLPAITPSFAVYVLVMAVFGTSCAIPFPVFNAVVGHAWPAGGRRAFNFLYVSNNLGVAIGTALGGAMASNSFRSVFFGIAVGYASLLLLVVTVLRRPLYEIRAQLRDDAGDSNEGLRAPIPWGGIGILLAGYITAWMVYVQWQSTVSVYMQATGYSLASYSLLWTLNGLIIFLAQPLVSYVTRRFWSLAAHMVGGVILLALSFFFMLFAHNYVMYVIAMLLTTLGEIFVWPAVPAAIAQIAPAGRLGTLQGLVGSAATCGRMIGPVLGGVLYDYAGFHFILLYAIPTLILPVILFLLYHRFTAPHLDEMGPERRF